MLILSTRTTALDPTPIQLFHDTSAHAWWNVFFRKKKKKYVLGFANAVKQCFILNDILLSDGLLWGKVSFSLEIKL